MSRIFLSPPHAIGREQALVAEVFASNYLAPAGPMLEAFEKAFCDYVGLPHAVALSSGTAALQLALRILDVGPGDAVIVPTLTFIGGVAPVVYQGAQPIFVDCDEESWNLDPSLLTQAFALAEARGLKVAAVMPTDLYGQCAAIDDIRALCDPRGVPVVLDSAEGMGAFYKGRHAGNGARMAAYSFNGNKIMTTSGGGMLASEDKAVIDRARYLATAARQPVAHYEHTEIGFNYRLGSLSAALGLGQLETLDEKVRTKRAIFAEYQSRLGVLPGLSFAPEAPERLHTRWLTVMQIDREAFGAGPSDIIAALEAENIESRPVWKPMHLQPVFQTAGRVGGGVAERLFERGVCLPSGTAMTSSDLDRVVKSIERLHPDAKRSARA